jgi:hypothetical protein
MTNDSVSKHDQVLWLLVMNLQAGAMTQLGKMPDPQTGESTVNLPAARMSIDLLEMLQAKCRGDTDAEILAALDQAVTNLQLNYVDEKKKAQAAESTRSPEEPAPAPADDAPSAGDTE